MAARDIRTRSDIHMLEVVALVIFFELLRLQSLLIL